MPVTVKMPDGSTAQFPDGMAPGDIQSAIETHLASTQPAGVPKSDAVPKLSEHAAPPAMNEAPQTGFLRSFADSSGLSGLGHAIAHPIDTVAGIPSAVANIAHNSVSEGKQAIDMAKQGSYGAALAHGALAVPVVGQSMQKAMDQTDGDQGSYGANLKSLVANPSAMGTIAGTSVGVVAPAAAGKILPAVGESLQAAGDTASGGGIGLLNKTVGALKNDFKRGANPARGYLEAGGGPALTMAGLADKAAMLKKGVGSSIGDAVANSNAVIPTSDVTKLISAPISKARDLEMGPGGLGNTNTIDAYADNLAPTFEKAFQSGKGMTPQDVFDLKRGIAQNTNWSDPSQFNLKAVRQQQTGALGGLLGDAVPEVKPLNQQYGDLNNFTKRAQSRAETGSSPLTHLAAKAGLTSLGAGIGAFGGAHDAIGGALLGSAVDSIPVKSAIATGLYRGGNGLSTLGTGVAGLPPLSPAVVAPAAYALDAYQQSRDKQQKKDVQK